MAANFFSNYRGRQLYMGQTYNNKKKEACGNPHASNFSPQKLIDLNHPSINGNSDKLLRSLGIKEHFQIGQSFFNTS